VAARSISFTLNGRAVSAAVKPHHNLVEMLEAQFALTGARESCGQGLCGCCTVMVDGLAVSGCLYLAVFADGKTVSTIEILATPQALDPVQQAFIDCGAFQCGYCTPGMVMAATELLRDNPRPSRQEVIDHLAGNICRCTGYETIVSAVLRAAEISQEDVQ
jgi:aerobic-type carbon monoxide dehydrogenase small subunit (CoxS/CutS family)